jgi:hypothetical protein
MNSGKIKVYKTDNEKVTRAIAVPRQDYFHRCTGSGFGDLSF